ncbi:MAG: S-adenosylmethionine:tRNA ribosyltransferase-isomerase [Bacteroidetes bacterium]|nr:S-adenosylmethionine:tRNA ribosyltransferase-isomerase [Bacteroidota bacterium]
MHPADIKIQDYSYVLPDALIARYPLAERDSSQLLVYKQGHIATDCYQNISRHIPAGSMLVFNNTKVIHARILFTTDSGATVEVFCLEPLEEMSKAMSSQGYCVWSCMVGRAAKWKQKQLRKTVSGFSISADMLSRTDSLFQIQFSWQPDTCSFAEILDKIGVLPIPPYLQRDSEAIDLERYQTIYAKAEGSVAAPTAGLHFTDQVMSALHANDVSCEEVTLHVGAGTFKPVKTETMQGHEMHAEMMHVERSLIKSLIWQIRLGLPIVAVGTTSLRTLESLYWMGLRVTQNENATLSDMVVEQWDVYEPENQKWSGEVSAEMALQNLVTWMQKYDLEQLICRTQILIAPPYQLRIAHALATNFHQPNSTLLLLVAAVVGENWRKIYQYALDNKFRFLSYGDGSLLWKQ